MFDISVRYIVFITDDIWFLHFTAFEEIHSGIMYSWLYSVMDIWQI